MTERPILFSAEMVRAILDGRKTQTRRIIKPQPYVDANGNACWKNTNFGQDLKRTPSFKSLASPLPCSNTKRVLCPYGAPGDQLWVREAWRVAAWKECGHIAVDYRSSPEDVRTPWAAVPDDQWDRLWRQSIDDARRAGEAGRGTTRRDGNGWKWDRGDSPCRWRPSIHMPRSASRITLEVKGVRVERLQDISEDDARAEGVEPITSTGWQGQNTVVMTASEVFADLWNKINGPGAWDANPWIWVIRFERVKP